MKKNKKAILAQTLTTCDQPGDMTALIDSIATLADATRARNALTVQVDGLLTQLAMFRSETQGQIAKLMNEVKAKDAEIAALRTQLAGGSASN